MKKLILPLLISVFMFLFADSYSQWQPSVRLTIDPASSWTSLNNAWCIASSGSVVHVVWTDSRDGNGETYYKRSTDKGVNWGMDTRLTNDSAFSQYPSVAVSGSVVHVVWHDTRDGNYEIYYKRSTDGGVSWGMDKRLTDYIEESLDASVSVSGSVVHVVWEDYRDGNWEIYYKRSTDGGVSWGTDTRLTNNSAVSQYPSVAVSGSVVHVVWEDFRDENPEIYYKRNPTGNPIGINTISTEVPTLFSLSQNYPNPFNPTTYIRFDLPKSSSVRLFVFDALGREVSTLINEKLAPGIYEVDWNGSDYPSGVYYYKLMTDNFSETKKMILVK
ncbi:T9SS type A sorting domain-containing protein [Bacteroidota bacterium]